MKAENYDHDFVLFSNMGLDTVDRFLFERSEIIFEKSKKINLDGTCVAERPVNVFIHFALGESISDEPQPTGVLRSYRILS